MAMPKKDFDDAMEGAMVGDDGGGDGLAVWIGGGEGGFVLRDFGVNVRNIVASIDGVVAVGGSSSVLLVVWGFSSAEGGISSSGIGIRVLVRDNTLRERKCGLRVQHRVRRRETMKAKAIVRKTVGSMIVRLRFSGDWPGNAMAMLVGSFVAVVRVIVGDLKGILAAVLEGEEMIELEFIVEEAVLFEGNIEAWLGGLDDDNWYDVIANVNSCELEDDDEIDKALEAGLEVEEMTMMDVDICNVGVGAKDGWASVLGGAKILGVRSGVVARGVSWPSFFGVCLDCPGGPGTPPAALLCLYASTAAPSTWTNKAKNPRKSIENDLMTLPRVFMLDSVNPIDKVLWSLITDGLLAEGVETMFSNIVVVL
jgi:hypothetical protein